ncbi:MAG: HAD family hydrolase [Vulcanimicrobiaceae bacterium]
MVIRPPTRAVLFDLDDTLHDDTQTYRRAARRVVDDLSREGAVDAEALFLAYVAQAERFWKSLTAELLTESMVATRERLWSAALAAVGTPDAVLARRCAEAYNRYRNEFLQLWPGVGDLLDTLRARGSRLGLITNGMSETHREKIALLGLADRFDIVLMADEAGMVKPDPRLFQLACARLGIEPRDATMIGDRYFRDITGAHDAGLFTIWLDIHGEHVAHDPPPHDLRVGDIAEVVTLLLDASAFPR